MTTPANLSVLRCDLDSHGRYPVIATSRLSPRTGAHTRRAYCGICARCLFCGQLGAALDAADRVLCTVHVELAAQGRFTELTALLTAYCTVAHQPPRPAVAALATVNPDGALRLVPDSRLCRPCTTCAHPDCSGTAVQLDREDRPRCHNHQNDAVREHGQATTVLISMDSTGYYELLRGWA